MDPTTFTVLQGAAGASGGDPVYVDDVFSTHLYDGNGGSQSINNGIDLAGEGGLVWMKRRSGTDSHILMDTLRPNKVLRSNNNAAEVNTTTTITSFNANGFSLGNPSQSGVNDNGEDIVSWSFRKAKGFFDVVTYTGNGSDRDISHSLGSEPGSIWIKRTDATESWIVYHRSLNSGGGSGSTAHFAKLELESSGTEFGGTLLWSSSGGGEDHTSTTFHVSAHGSVNQNGGTFVAYIFAHDDQSFGTNGNESIIKCGSYTGNTANQIIDIGFEPQFVLVKKYTNSQSWFLFDSMRGMSGTSNGSAYFFPNSTSAESLHDYMQAVPNGFQLIGSGGGPNDTGSYIYMAIRRPNKPPSAATEVFAIDTAGATSPTPPLFISGFPADFQMRFDTNSGNRIMHSRLQGTNSMSPAGTGSESSGSSLVWDYQNGWSSGTSVESNVYSYMFRRVPGFMDVTVWTGDASTNRAITHQLGVIPELVITKRRENSDSWWTQYTGIFGTNHGIRLDSTAGTNTLGVSAFNSTSAATSSVFYVGSDSTVNGANETYIAYVFASLDGISKVGTYDGSSSDINIDCGFSSGARFVMIKRTDTTGDWCVFDTSRGIVAGNDPVMKIGGGAQDTGNDLIDPLNAGFTVVGGNTFINNSNAGAKYLYLAIA